MIRVLFILLLFLTSLAGLSQRGIKTKSVVTDTLKINVVLINLGDTILTINPSTGLVGYKTSGAYDVFIRGDTLFVNDTAFGYYADVNKWTQSGGKLYPTTATDDIVVKDSLRVEGASLFKGNVSAMTKIYAKDSISVPQGGRFRIGSQYMYRSGTTTIGFSNGISIAQDAYITGITYLIGVLQTGSSFTVKNKALSTAVPFITRDTVAHKEVQYNFSNMGNITFKAFNGISNSSFTTRDTTSSVAMMILENIGRITYSPKNTGNVVAGTGITSAMLGGDMRYNGSSAIDISANPQITTTVTDGMVISITGLSDVNTLTLDDGTGLQLAGAASFVIGEGDNITLRYISSLAVWVEVSRSNN